MTLMQGGAPAHTTKATQKLLKDKFATKGFSEKTMWPPSGSNLNPLDFWVWSAIEAVTNQKRHSNVVALKKKTGDIRNEVLLPEKVRSIWGRQCLSILRKS